MRRYTTLLLTAFLLLAIVMALLVLLNQIVLQINKKASVIAGSAYLAGTGHIDHRTREQEITVLTTLPAEEAEILSQAYEDSSGVHVTFVPLSSADVLERAKARGMKDVHLAAQVQAMPFYERLGFEPFGDEFDEAGIPHRMMRLVF